MVERNEELWIALNERIPTFIQKVPKFWHYISYNKENNYFSSKKCSDSKIAWVREPGLVFFVLLLPVKSPSFKCSLFDMDSAC